jgi:hypothetical protein
MTSTIAQPDLRAIFLYVTGRRKHRKVAHERAYLAHIKPLLVLSILFQEALRQKPRAHQALKHDPQWLHDKEPAIICYRLALIRRGIISKIIACVIRGEC